MADPKDDKELVLKPQLAFGNVTIDFRDILAVGVVLLALGAVTVAIIIAIGFVRGAVSSSDATTLILGCVGGSAIAAIVAAIVKGKK